MENQQLTIATIWLTGLAAAGKTTLGEKLEKNLLALGIKNVVFLDGERVRDELNNFAYSTNDRNELGLQKAMLAKKYNDEGTIAIITGIAHHKATRDKVREQFKNYSEVYLRCSAEVCAERDYKGHYAKAYAGEYENFVGVTEPYEESENPDLILNTAENTIEKCSEKLLEHVLAKINFSNVKEVHDAKS